MNEIGILGTGSWAIGLASALLEKNKNIIMWGRDKKQISALTKTGKNPKYSLACELKGTIKFTNNLSDLSDIKYLINAIPTQHIREVLEKMALETSNNKIPKETLIINVSKGIEIKTLKFISEIFAEFYPENEYLMLSGPSHAEEVAKKLPTTLVVAGNNDEKAKEVQELFFASNLRIYRNADIKGVELASALKNVIALATGISDGLGYGDNTKAALMTRGIAEIKRLGKIIGAKESTFNGLAGIGDLIVTCTSMHSRNRRCGILIGEGLDVGEATKRIGMAVEGVHTVKAAENLARKHKVELPLTEALYKVLYESMKPQEAVISLMSRDMKQE